MFEFKLRQSNIIQILHGELGNWQNGIGILTLIAISSVVTDPANRPPKNLFGLALSFGESKKKSDFVRLKSFLIKLFLSESFPSICGYRWWHKKWCLEFNYNSFFDTPDIRIYLKIKRESLDIMGVCCANETTQDQQFRTGVSW